MPAGPTPADNRPCPQRQRQEPAATADQLRADIDAGRTGDKTQGSDPAAAPLGTDEEAAGVATPPEALARARRLEANPGLQPAGSTAGSIIAPDASPNKPPANAAIWGIAIAAVIVAVAGVIGWMLAI